MDQATRIESKRGWQNISEANTIRWDGVVTSSYATSTAYINPWDLVSEEIIDELLRAQYVATRECVRAYASGDKVRGGRWESICNDIQRLLPALD